MPGDVAEARARGVGTAVARRDGCVDDLEARKISHAHPDGNREIRAICMAALPCPPLPIMASLEEEGGSNTSCGEAVGNSHDFISHLMNVRAAADQQDVNEARMRAQVAVNEALMQRFDSWVAGSPRSGSPAHPSPPLSWDRGSGQCPTSAPPVDKIYEFFGEFTRGYIGSFLCGTASQCGATLQPPDVRMYPIESVRVGDRVHAAAVDFARAQDRIFGPCEEWRAMCGIGESQPIPADTPYASLVVLSAMRIMCSG